MILRGGPVKRTTLYTDPEGIQTAQQSVQNSLGYNTVQTSPLREGPDYNVGEQSVGEKLECMHKEAGRARYFYFRKSSYSIPCMPGTGLPCVIPPPC